MENIKPIVQVLVSDIAEKLKNGPVEIAVKPISSEGANYTSELFEAIIKSQGQDDMNCFAKVAVVGEKMRAVCFGNIYKTEIYAYKELLKKYKNMEEKYNVPLEFRLCTAIFYGASDEYLKETVVLENLKIRGFEAFDRFKPIDWKYASKSITQLANFHALSIALSMYDPEEFQRSKLLLNADLDMESKLGMMKNIINNVLDVVKEENKERMTVFIKERLEDGNFEKLYLQPTKRPVIIHGDYRPSNLMHRHNEDGTLEVIPLDFQTVRHASPLMDLFHFIFTGSDKKFRDEHYASSVELYYTELCNALRRLDVDPNNAYPRDDFDYEYREFLPFGLIIGVLTLFVVTVEVDKAPKINKDINIIDTFDIKANAMYKERINDIIDDYIKMGVL